jgi:hypothetical protein
MSPRRRPLTFPDRQSRPCLIIALALARACDAPCCLKLEVCLIDGRLVGRSLVRAGTLTIRVSCALLVCRISDSGIRKAALRSVWIVNDKIPYRVRNNRRGDVVSPELEIDVRALSYLVTVVIRAACTTSIRYGARIFWRKSKR